MPIKVTTKDFIEKAQQIHGNKYIYDKVKYENNRTKVCIICPEHGEFLQTPDNHINRKSGCPKCAIETSKNKQKKSTQDFINEAKKIHGNKYDYSKVKYINNKIKIIIICSKHGEFLQSPINHLKNHGCPKCGIEQIKTKQRKHVKNFIKEAKQLHNNKYDYSKTNYINNKTKIEIICHKHGSFWQAPNYHLTGQGCPKCIYKTQEKIYSLIKDNITDNIIFNDRQIIKPKEIDIYLPHYKLAIEFNGLMYHSYGKSNIPKFNNYRQINKYHLLNKTKLCNKQNIHLIHIWENEWILKKEIILSIIKSYCNKYDNIYYARQCYVKEINKNVLNNFINENHIQGNINASIKLGLYYNDKLISVMSFGKSRFNKNYKWELLRFCNKLNTKVIGGASKLFKYFLRNYYDGSGIISYCDRRYFTGGLYEKLGFKFLIYSKPNYYYFHVDNILKIYHRVTFQKHKLKNKLRYYNEKLTEKENMFNNGYRLIYDCGQSVWIYE